MSPLSFFVFLDFSFGATAVVAPLHRVVTVFKTAKLSGNVFRSLCLYLINVHFTIPTATDHQ